MLGASDLPPHARDGASSALDGGWRIETTAGAIEAEYVINAAGYRGAEVAAMIGDYLPVVTLSHQYLITEDIPALAARGMRGCRCCAIRTSVTTCARSATDCCSGRMSREPQAQWLTGIPEAFAQQLFADDLGRLEPYIEEACARVPILGSVGVKRVINGPIPYAPDGNPLIGPAPGARNFFHCCAFTLRHRAGRRRRAGHGQWVVNGEPDWDVWPLDSRRYVPSRAAATRWRRRSRPIRTNTRSPTHRRSARRGGR